MVCGRRSAHIFYAIYNCISLLCALNCECGKEKIAISPNSRTRNILPFTHTFTHTHNNIAQCVLCLCVFYRLNRIDIERPCGWGQAFSRKYILCKTTALAHVHYQRACLRLTPSPPTEAQPRTILRFLLQPLYSLRIILVCPQPALPPRFTPPSAAMPPSNNVLWRVMECTHRAAPHHWLLDDLLSSNARARRFWWHKSNQPGFNSIMIHLLGGMTRSAELREMWRIA